MRVTLALLISVLGTQAFGQQQATCGNGRVVASGEDVRFVDSSGNSISVYDGKFSVAAIASCNSGVVTIFKGKDEDAAYFSPNCLNVGGGGSTVNVYQNDHRNRGLVTHPTGIGVLAQWQHTSGGETYTYYSPDCRNLGGGGQTSNVSKNN